MEKHIDILKLLNILDWNKSSSYKWSDLKYEDQERIINFRIYKRLKSK